MSCFSQFQEFSCCSKTLLCFPLCFHHLMPAWRCVFTSSMARNLAPLCSNPSVSSALAPCSFIFPWRLMSSWLWAACPFLRCSNRRPPSQITCSSWLHPNPDQSPPPKSVVPPVPVPSAQPLNEPPAPLRFLPPSAATLLGLVLALPCTLCPLNVRYSSSICSWNLLSAGEPVSDGCISTYSHSLFLQL